MSPTMPSTGPAGRSLRVTAATHLALSVVAVVVDVIASGEVRWSLVVIAVSATLLAVHVLLSTPGRRGLPPGRRHEAGRPPARLD